MPGTQYIRNLSRAAAVLPFLFLFSGCGVWTDFTTYFNIYYNANESFQEAEQQIVKEQNKDIFSLNEQGVNQNAGSAFIKVAEKCSKILQFYSESALVDDALMMLGKSFYYQRNYIKALRKFQELTATQPNSNLLPEAELWIARTELQMKNAVEGLPHLRAARAKALAAGEEDVVNLSYIDEIRYLLSEKKTTEAITLCKEMLAYSTDGKLNAMVVFQLGELYTAEEKYSEAAEAYLRTGDYSPDYDLMLKAQIRYGRSLRSMAQHKEALEVFLDLKSENKYSDQFDAIDLEIGKTLRADGRTDEAYERLKYVDTAYQNSMNAGNARFELGQLYEAAFKNFDSANAYYQKAISSPLTVEYLEKARQKSQLFNKYFLANSTYRQQLKQLAYVINPDAFVRDSIAFYSDTLQTGNPNSPRSTGEDEETRIRNRERNREQGREDESTFRRTTGEVQQPGTPVAPRIPPVRPVIGKDSLVFLTGGAALALGNIFFNEFNYGDSAYFYYRTTLDSFPDRRYNAQVLMALASYHLTINDSVSADTLYRFVYEHYKDDKIVNLAATRINKPLIDFDFDAGKQLYTAAETTLRGGNAAKAATDFYSIFTLHPESAFAPKALYATGYILENELKLYDSAAVVYDTLARVFPRSQYTTAINPKLGTYKMELAAREKAVKDSLDKLNAPKDSLVAVDTTSGTIKKTDETTQPELSGDKGEQKEGTPSVTPPAPDANKEKSDDPRRREGEILTEVESATTVAGQCNATNLLQALQARRRSTA